MNTLQERYNYNKILNTSKTHREHRIALAMLIALIISIGCLVAYQVTHLMVFFGILIPFSTYWGGMFVWGLWKLHNHIVEYVREEYQYKK